MLSNVTHSNSYFECNKKRGCIDQLYIELGLSENWKKSILSKFNLTILVITEKSVQIKAELLMDLVHLGSESAVFVSKTKCCVCKYLKARPCPFVHIRISKFKKELFSRKLYEEIR